MKYQCPCCGFYTLDARKEYEVCPVCFWEDDPIQAKDEQYSGGANKVSLEQARKNYAEFGACEIEMLKYVRKPNNDEYNEMD